MNLCGILAQGPCESSLYWSNFGIYAAEASIVFYTSLRLYKRSKHSGIFLYTILTSSHLKNQQCILYVT